jgi:hypothetical protein
MNRLTAIGLASLVAYGLLITSKYTGIVSAARDDKSLQSAMLAPADMLPAGEPRAVAAEPRQYPIPMPAPVARAEPARASAVALEFRNTRDLKSFADALAARQAQLTADERYHLAKALEECQFATSINEDLAAYSAKQRRQFLAGLPNGDPNNAKRIAAYEAVDTTQRCLRFQGSKISPKDIEDLFLAAAQQGDPRAQARTLVAELNIKNNANKGSEQSQSARVAQDDFSRIVGLLESRDPEAIIIVGQFLAQQSVANQLRIGPAPGDVPEPAAFLGAFSLVACDLGSDCSSGSREPMMACAYSGYCGAVNFEELYRDYMASPWSLSVAMRYRVIISNAINTQNWSLIGLQPPSADKRRTGSSP